MIVLYTSRSSPRPSRSPPSVEWWWLAAAGRNGFAARRQKIRGEAPAIFHAQRIIIRYYIIIAANQLRFIFIRACICRGTACVESLFFFFFLWCFSSPLWYRRTTHGANIVHARGEEKKNRRPLCRPMKIIYRFAYDIISRGLPDAYIICRRMIILRSERNHRLNIRFLIYDITHYVIYST